MTDHVRAGELIPWLANKRLEGDNLAWLNTHLDGCAACQAQLAAERQVVAALNSHGTVEYAPQPSFNRLWSRIESDSHASGRAVQNLARAPAATRRRPYARIAAGLLLAAGLGTLFWQGASPPSAAAYRTVTDPTPTAPAGSLKVIFSDAATLADVKVILGSAGLRVLAGPTEAGIFTVGASAPGAQPDLDSSLKTLRNDPRVRFAEPSAGGN